jgi:hypothetical protein
MEWKNTGIPGKTAKIIRVSKISTGFLVNIPTAARIKHIISG